MNPALLSRIQLANDLVRRRLRRVGQVDERRSSGPAHPAVAGDARLVGGVATLPAPARGNRVQLVAPGT
jgi:hypothetical protein